MIRNSAVGILINSNNEFLLQKKTADYHLCPGQWCLFGGEFKSNESPLDAIKRELEEELGLELSNMSYFFKNSWKMGKREYREDVFVVFFDKNIMDIKLSEGAGFALFNKNELSSLNLFNKSKIALEKYILESD